MWAWKHQPAPTVPIRYSDVMTYLCDSVAFYVNMGESQAEGNASSHKNREVFYASGVDKLAKFVDRYHREIRVILSYYKMQVSSVLYKSRYYRSYLVGRSELKV